MQFASARIGAKDMRKLVNSLEAAGLQVSTTAKQHIKVINPRTGKSVFFGAQSLGDPRANKNIKRDLRLVGFNKDINI
jgi:hypothetical protein